MGREIRKVPPNWKHEQRNRYGHFQPMFDKTFEQACAEWDAAEAVWIEGSSEEAQKFKSKYPCYADWNGERPDDPSYYRPWKDEEATWFQVWETVSEGSPVTPAFATKEELIEYLVTNGDDYQGKQWAKPWSRKAAEQFVQSEWSPSAAIIDGKLYTPETGFP